MCTTCAKHNPGSKKKAAAKTAKRQRRNRKIPSENYQLKLSEGIFI